MLNQEKKTEEPQMFVDFDMSRTGVGKHLGYWKTSRTNDPNILPWPGDFIDNNWDPIERDKVADYLDRQPDVQHWRGYSYCRLGCQNILIGSTDKSDGVYTWPAGFSHYLRVHNVKPPQEFIEHALGKTKSVKSQPSHLAPPYIYSLPDCMVVGTKVKVCMPFDDDLPVGTVVTIHSFVGEYVNVRLANGQYRHYLRGDFAHLFKIV